MLSKKSIIRKSLFGAIATVVLSILGVAVVSAQTMGDRFVVKTRNGWIMVWNAAPDDCFTFYLKGTDLKLGDTPSAMFTIDEQFFQIQTVPIGDFLKERVSMQNSEAAVLEAHRDWEFAYLEKMLERKLKIESEKVEFLKGKPALFWSVDVPADLALPVQKQLYLTIQNGRNVILLNSVVDADHSFASVKELLMKTLSTLNTSTKPYGRDDFADKLEQ